MSIVFSFRYNSSSLRFGLISWQFQNRTLKPMKLIKRYLSRMAMHYSGLLGGFRLFEDSLGGIARRRDGFQCGEWFSGEFGGQGH